MRNVIIALILLSFIFISCGRKDNNNIPDSERELVDLLENITKEEDGTNNLDSATSKRLLEVVDNVAGKWKEIKSERGNFRIEFPDYEVKEGQTTQLLDGEEITIYHYSINTQNKNHDNLGYRVDYSFWPNIKTKDQIDEQFNVQRDYVLSATNATLEYENIIDTLSYPGRELYLTIDDSKIKMRYRMFFNNGIFYKLMVVTEDGKHFNKSSTKFLNSFKTLNEIN
ncbi:MAG TPA: hypothetical protein VGD22_16815 [Sphingobacteriaceae bacterium]